MWKLDKNFPEIKWTKRKIGHVARHLRAVHGERPRTLENQKQFQNLSLLKLSKAIDCSSVINLRLSFQEVNLQMGNLARHFLQQAQSELTNGKSCKTIPSAGPKAQFIITVLLVVMSTTICKRIFAQSYCSNWLAEKNQIVSTKSHVQGVQTSTSGFKLLLTTEILRFSL